MLNDTLPLIGAAMPSTHLDQHLDWIISDQRDLEIQDFALHTTLENPGVMDHVRELKQKLDGYSGRMGIHAPFWSLTLAAFDPKIRMVVQDRFKQSLDIAAELGATHMVIHSPLAFLGAPHTLTNPSMGSDASLFDLVHETIGDTVSHAESVGCTLVIENIYDKLPRMLTELVQSFESDYVRQSLDAGHAYINYVQGAPPPDYYVKTAGDLLEHVHVQDTDGYTDRHWAIGQGKIDWHGLFDEISKLNSQPRLILELRDTNDIQSSAQYLADLGLVR
jgi:sugar phosphate isomerase/epimerase